MRAFSVEGFGQAPALHQMDAPRPQTLGDFLVKVAVAGVNPVDFKRVEWLMADSHFPYVLGVDFAGTIEEAPPGDHGFKAGERIFGMARRSGAYADYALVSQTSPGEAFAHIPPSISFEQAAVLPVAGATASGSLDLLTLRPGETLVILGAAGGVGGYAVPLARRMGAHVVAVTPGGAAEARRLGAHEVFDGVADQVLPLVRAAHPDGVDAVLDLVSDQAGLPSVAKLLREGGRLVSTQRAADEHGLATTGVTAHNISAPENPKATERGLAELATALQDGVIEARIAYTTDLRRSGDALHKVREGGIRGKAVVLVDR